VTPNSESSWEFVRGTENLQGRAMQPDNTLKRTGGHRGHPVRVIDGARARAEWAK
jgi:hypothetical protein